MNDLRGAVSRTLQYCRAARAARAVGSGSLLAAAAVLVVRGLVWLVNSAVLAIVAASRDSARSVVEPGLLVAPELDAAVERSQLVRTLTRVFDGLSAAAGSSAAARTAITIMRRDLRARVSLAGATLTAAVVTHAALAPLTGQPLQLVAWILHAILAAGGALIAWCPEAAASAWHARIGDRT